MNEENRDIAFLAGLVSVGVLVGAVIGYCFWSVAGAAELPILAGSSALGGVVGLSLGWQMRTSSSLTFRLVIEAIGFLFSLSGLALAVFLLTEDHLAVVPLSTTAFIVALWLRLVPKERRAVPIGIGSAALATVGIVEGLALQSWPLIAVGAICAIGIIVPFKVRHSAHKSGVSGKSGAAA